MNQEEKRKGKQKDRNQKMVKGKEQYKEDNLFTIFYIYYKIMKSNRRFSNG